MIVLSFVLFLKGFSDVENKGAMSYNIIIIGSIVVLSENAVKPLSLDMGI